MKKYNITVNGTTYEVVVEEVGSVDSVPTYTAPIPTPAPVATPVVKTAAPKTAKAPKAAAKPLQPESVFSSKDDEYLFAQGTHYDIYKKLGAHVSEENGRKQALMTIIVNK